MSMRAFYLSVLDGKLAFVHQWLMLTVITPRCMCSVIRLRSKNYQLHKHNKSDRKKTSQRTHKHHQNKRFSRRFRVNFFSSLWQTTRKQNKIKQTKKCSHRLRCLCSTCLIHDDTHYKISMFKSVLIWLPVRVWLWEFRSECVRVPLIQVNSFENVCMCVKMNCLLWRLTQTH